MFKLLRLLSLVPCRIIPTGVNLNESPMEQAAGINPLLLFIADVGFGLQYIFLSCLRGQKLRCPG
jgi:hypothetical protein